jgi:hypothetical protein
VNRIQILKGGLWKMEDRAVLLGRMEILKECAEKSPNETAGARFGHTLLAPRNSNVANILTAVWLALKQRCAR